MNRRCSFGFKGFLLLALALVAFIGFAMPDQGDVALYLRAASGIAAGKWPYTDFSLEYPPGALLAFLPPYPGFVLASDSGYFGAFALWGIACAAALAVFLRRTLSLWRGPDPPEPTLTGRNLAALCLVMGWLITGRYDIFPAALIAVSLWALIGERATLAGGALGVAFAAKLYPIVFAPVFFGWLLAKKEHRGAIQFALAALFTATLCFLPFLLHAPQALGTFIEYHRNRGIQVESGAAGIALLLGGGNHVDLNYGAFHLDGPLPQLFLPILTVLFPLVWLIALARTYYRFRNEPITETALIECSAGSLLLFIAFNKVFSPQFMIWLIPFLPLLRPVWRRFGTPLFIATTLIFPLSYSRLLSGSLEMVLLLNLRNAGVLLLGILLLIGKKESQLPASDGAF